MPDFQQFAERCAEMKDYLQRSGLAADSPEFQILPSAERHARLLQQIWEWANADPIHFQNDDKAHVRSLLVGQQEAKE